MKQTQIINIQYIIKTNSKLFNAFINIVNHN